ncbi:MAG: hypothetical protein WEC33_09195 [Dehalococcoidia bacterium]
MLYLRLLLALFVLPLGAAFFACGGGDGDDGQGDPAGNGDDDDGDGGNGDGDDDDGENGDGEQGRGACNVTVSGDIETTFVAPGGAAALGTDYWLSEDQLRSALEFLYEFEGGLSEDEQEAEVDRLVEEFPGDEVLVYIFLMNCDEPDGENYIGLFPGPDATYADVPFGPATYTIAAGGLFGADAGPDEFGALITIQDEDGEQVSFAVSEPGTLMIEEWDDDHVAGTFTFRAEEVLADAEPREIEVTGNFDLRE